MSADDSSSCIMLSAYVVSMQAALQESHDQNQRLTLTVSAMRSDMELLQHHATSPGPQANPSQTPPCFPQAHDHSQSSYQGHQLHGQQNAGPRKQEEGWRPSAGDHQPTLHAQQHKQQQQQQEEEIQLLCHQLQDARAEAEGLGAENERLMEMSNALRSECDRSAATQQHQHVMAATSSGTQGSLQQPCIGMPLSPGLEPQQMYYQAQQAYPLGPQSMPPGQPMHPHTIQWAAQGMPQQPCQGFPQQPQMPQALMSTEGQGSSGQLWHNVQQPQLPAGLLAAPLRQHQDGLTATTPDDALPHEVVGINVFLLQYLTTSGSQTPDIDLIKAYNEA